MGISIGQVVAGIVVSVIVLSIVFLFYKTSVDTYYNKKLVSEYQKGERWGQEISLIPVINISYKTSGLTEEMTVETFVKHRLYSLTSDAIVSVFPIMFCSERYKMMHSYGTILTTEPKNNGN